MSTVIPFDLDNQKGVNLSSCELAKPNQLIVCLFKPEDLFDLSGFGSAGAKQAVNIMGFFTPDQIARSKDILWDKIDNCTIIGKKMAQRKTSNQRK
jgi:predicted flap endonuclease-1-like 5' DNA nuclease